MAGVHVAIIPVDPTLFFDIILTFGKDVEMLLQGTTAVGTSFRNQCSLSVFAVL